MKMGDVVWIIVYKERTYTVHLITYFFAYHDKKETSQVWYSRF